MNPRILRMVPAVLAAGGMSLAIAQPSESQPEYVGSVASASKLDGDGAVIANDIVQAMLSDRGMAGAKVTVQPEDGHILLTGVARTPAQERHAVELAQWQSRGESVMSAIQVEHTPSSPR